MELIGFQFENLASITIPSTLVKIEDGGFKNVKCHINGNLNSISELGNYALEGCEGFDVQELPESIKK